MFLKVCGWICLCFLIGCQPRTVEKPVITIDDVIVTREEFQRAYEASVFSKIPGDQRKNFLEFFIARKLILREAERWKLDRDPEFLSDIQLFWEQSLLKRVLLKKAEDPSFQPIVSQQEIEEFFQGHRDGDFAQRSLEEAQEDIETILVKKKQQEEIQRWINALRLKARITIDASSLGLRQDSQEAL